MLADARDILLSLTPQVFIAGDPLPEGGAPHLILQPIDATDRVRYGSAASVTRVQVSAWAPTLSEALELSDQARNALRAARFVPAGSGPLTDPDITLTGWRADYRRQ
ncbi:hypothetical protein DGo_CA1898 [Deinococcus gobiensis I-0]|uniref:DUF3168 domain-containing protein n=1 Tax=Deinococcus gobiensis (strain DSM 21396 / JCM 16679 / CGMCC 1.7299 / I-0) TaxID=745776 RepID=H8GX96_DEIGI|nr:hypothetical protein DGo_CA1898 [Deinococcus gobiensis I-0]